MSLINTMLRDLDERQAAENGSVIPRIVRPSPVPGSVTSSPHSAVRIMLVCALIVIVVGLGYYWAGLMSTNAPHIVSSGAASSAPSVVIPMPSTAPSAVTEQRVAGKGHVEAASASVPLTMTGSVPARTSPVSILQIDSRLLQIGSSPAPVEVTAPDRSKPAAVVKSAPGVVEKVVRVDAEAEQPGIGNYRKGLALIKQGRMAEGMEWLQVSLRENPRQIVTRQTLLSLLVEQKQWEDAQVLLKNGLEILPEQVGWAMTLARIQVETGYIGDAWSTLQKYQAQAGQHAEYQGFAGTLLQQLQRPHEAVTYYQRALQLRPGEGRWWYGMGLALESDGRAVEARDAFQKAKTVGGITPDMRLIIDKKLN